MVGIGFFAPFPLALMVPFMAGQSLAMGEAFGKGFQYGKRKISSMNNEEFNALNFQQLSESIATDYKTMIPSLKKSIEASDELQRAVFKALGDLLLDIPDSIKSFFQEATSSATGGTLTSYGTSPTSAQLVDPRGINALLSLWESIGIIKKGSTSKFQEQYTDQRDKAIQKSDDLIFQENKQGPTVTPRPTIPTPSSNTLVLVNGKWVTNDTRIEDAKLPPPQSTVGPTKRKAGQSQILEKKHLENLIAQDLKFRGKISNPYQQRLQATARMKVSQQKLANLKARYSF